MYQSLPIPKPQVETITPEIAAEMLKHNPPTNQKRLSKTYVNSYASTMRRGEWKLNGQSIDFDYNGNLLNGQHRLHACIAAGIPFQAVVVRGLDPDCFHTYDNGLARTAGPLLGMQNVPNFNVVACAIKTAEFLRRDLIATAVGGKVRDITNSMIITLMERDRDMYIRAGQFAVSIRSKVGKTFLTPGMMAGYVYHLIRNLGYEEEKVYYFFNAICSFETNSNITLDAFRRRILKDLASKEKMTNEYKQNLLAKVWNAWVDGREIKNISWNKEKEGKIEIKGINPHK